MEFRFREVPWESSLFFIGWIWLGLSMFGMTLVNMFVPKLNLYHFVAGMIYLFPVIVVGFKIVKNRNLIGLPLFVCSGIIGAWAILLHMKMNLGYNYEFFPGQIQKTVMLLLLLVAVPLSYYVFARSVGCKDTRNMKALKIFPVIAFFIIFITEILGISYYEVANYVLFSFLLLIGPLLGGLYIWEIMSNIQFKNYTT
jgi:hypothetical protein